jgi:peptidoglycan/LPS O-acetylase OafA/YrhL
VFIGASGEVKTQSGKQICKFLGDISYPIYITHFPFIYLYTAYVLDNKLSFGQAYPVAILVFIAAIVLAYLSLKYYDEPVRSWLKNKFLLKK